MMELVFARPGQEEEAGALLDACTERLLAKQIFQWTLPWPREALAREIQAGELIFGLMEGRLAALAAVGRRRIALPAPLGTAEGFYLSHLAADPALARQGVGAAFTKELFKRYSPLYLDCWAGNERLKAFYASLGMRCLGEAPEEDYFISQFVSEGEKT